ncbi:potassium channel subfamily U member 1-like [Lissotriton helveticus]
MCGADPECANRKLFRTRLYSSGSVFSDTLMDSIMSTAYDNPQILALIQTLVTGGTTPELEEQLADDNTLIRHSMNAMSVAERDRCKLSLLPVTKTLLDSLSILSFGEVFSKALDSFGILCLGVYRLFEEPNPFLNRFVITKPPNTFTILPTDLLFAAVPFKGQRCRDYMSEAAAMPALVPAAAKKK